MDNAVIASMDDVEKVIREYMDIDYPDTVCGSHIEKVEDVFGTILYFKQQSDVDPSDFDLHTWGWVGLVKVDNKTQITFFLEPSGIAKIWDGDHIRYREKELIYQYAFEDANRRILEKFDKAETTKPKRPEPGSSPNTWFDYLHAMIDSGFDIDLKEIAKEIPLDYNYTRQLHARYASERGLPRLGKRPNK